MDWMVAHRMQFRRKLSEARSEFANSSAMEGQYRISVRGIWLKTKPNMHKKVALKFDKLTEHRHQRIGWIDAGASIFQIKLLPLTICQYELEGKEMKETITIGMLWFDFQCNLFSYWIGQAKLEGQKRRVIALKTGWNRYQFNLSKIWILRYSKTDTSSIPNFLQMFI